jgi:hypothetical protein
MIHSLCIYTSNSKFFPFIKQDHICNAVTPAQEIVEIDCPRWL